jgi:crotonobetaine/carnitine-CoA ligase
MLDRRLVLPHAITEAAARTPDALAIINVAGGDVSFAELADAVRRWAAALDRLGVSPGDTVLTMLPNSFESYYAWLGAAWLRAIEVPLNTQYRGQMLAYAANHCEAKVAVISERYLDRLEPLLDELVHLKCVLVPHASGSLPELPFEIVGRDVLTESNAVDVGPGPDYFDIAAMIFTSGTTGPSKGVLVPWAQMYHNTTVWPSDTLDPRRGLYSPWPAFHAAGKSLFYFSIHSGARLVLREAFSPGAFWHDVATYRCQAALLSGPMASMLMAAPPAGGDSATLLESVCMYPLIPEVEAFKARFGVRVVTAYGMTEIGTPALSGWDLVNDRSCGRRRAGYDVRIVDDHDEPLEPGHVGELVVRTTEPWLLCAGYWRMPDKTAEAWRNGWFHTGDAFREDEDGNFYFVDRIKDAIRRRGENISSFEVEACVNAHPAVAESAAVAVPSELGEDDLKVVVVLCPGEQLDPAALIQWIIPRMPRFMIPRYVEFADEIPKTDATLRTQKMKLRVNPINPNTWDREKAGIVLPRG